MMEQYQKKHKKIFQLARTKERLKKRKLSKVKSLNPLLKRLKEEGKISEELEILINNITIEELIQLKLEISTKHVLFHKLYGFPLLGMIKEIAKDAIKNFARDNIASKREANEILGRF